MKSAVVDVIGQERSYGPPKSAAGRRAVAIPPHIIGDLEHHLAMYAQPGPQGLVFVGPKGGPIRRNNYASRVWAPAAEAAGLPAGSHLHDLRGWGATIPARTRSHHQGADAPARARLPGRGAALPARRTRTRCRSRRRHERGAEAIERHGLDLIRR
jgi:hypothetical protein